MRLWKARLEAEYAGWLPPPIDAIVAFWIVLHLLNKAAILYHNFFFFFFSKINDSK